MLKVLNETHLSSNVCVNHNISLVPNLSGTLPREIIKNVPYEKGCLLLDHLQRLLGYKNLHLIKCYHVTRFYEYQTNDFKRHLYHTFLVDMQVLEIVDWEMWFKEQNLPLHHMFSDIQINSYYDGETFIKEESKDILQSIMKRHLNDSAFRKITFISYLSWNVFRIVPDLQVIYVATCVFVERGVSKHGNYAHPCSDGTLEAQFLWLRSCIRSRWGPIIEDALQFASDNLSMSYYVCSIIRAIYEWIPMRHHLVSWIETNQSKMHAETIQNLELALKVKLDNLST
ncbi:PREDICTED: leukotriene A-4 hydrolase-like [Vollenhovia emeryi]|uniref:leukotriene A-4 hydrolase-like n=1 Tax=Vollenhovia emeryi TaxID=411798 RepID=UPI0005F53240|nr:PREDICTED: leukotriene A-4 hydrolase-like [Vollenhovia emeryi]